MTELPATEPIDKAVQILEGAMQEFLTHGYAATSMDRVAAAAGVSKATVYSHFGDKEGLFEALVKRLAQQKFLHLTTLDCWHEEPRHSLPQLITNALQHVLCDPEHLAFIRLIIGESGRFPKLAQIFVQNLSKPGIELMSQYLAKHPQLNIADPEATARIIIGAVVYFVQIQEMLHGQEIVPMEPERLINAITDLVITHQSPQAASI
nr:TetR/AcrR family transcriptional regulator [Petrachloros mirabilis]